MKNLIKLFPAALGLIALASCSNEDFLSSKNADDLSDKYVLTAIEEDDVVTRAFKDVNQSNTTYQINEVMRVYDSQMAKYDEFKFQSSAAGSFFTIPGAAANITEKNAEGNLDYAYALFGTDGEKISYAGWNGNNLALVKISPAQTYAETVSSLDGEARVYKENLPQWGTVKSEVTEKTTAARSFTTSLRYLTGRVKVVFENGANNGTPVQNVRVSSLKIKAGQSLAGLATQMTTDGIDQKSIVAGGFATKYATSVEANAAKPISGWFEAVLDRAKAEDGIRQITGADNIDAIKVADGSTITESVAGGAMDDYTNVFFFPIVPDTYDLLVFEYEDADGWHFIDYLPNVTVARGEKIETTDKDDWTAGIDLTVSNDLIVSRDYIQNTEAVSKIMSDNTIKEAPVIINLNPNDYGQHVKILDTDVESQNTIYIPQLKNNMTVNFKTSTYMYKKLVIKDAAGADNSNFTVKFNFSSIEAGLNEDIEIKTSAKELKLEGNYNNLGTKEIKVLAGNVTVVAEEGDTDIPVLTKATGDGTAAGNITVKCDDTNDLAITTLNAGDAAKLAISGDIATTAITTVNAEDVSEIEVSGATTTNVWLKKAPATFTVKGTGVITNIKADASLNTNLTADLPVNINTQDDAIISAFATNTTSLAKPGKMVYNLAATYTDLTTLTGAVQPASKEIYTAAQLNSIAGWGNDAKLMTTVTFSNTGDNKWTSPGLAHNFDGNNKAITNLNAPLFGVIGAAVTSIQKLNITNANITTASAYCGVLAKQSQATNLAVTASTVAGTINSSNAYVGGLIGCVTATAGAVNAEFGENAATTTVTVDVTLNNTKTYNPSLDVLDAYAGTWGEYVGSVVSGGTNNATVVINKDCAAPKSATNTASALNYNWQRDADFDMYYKVKVLGYFKPTMNVEGSSATVNWIGFVGKIAAAIPVNAPTDLAKITLTYPMTVNGVASQVTFPNATPTAYGADGTKYTFELNGMGAKDKSGVKVAGTPKTAVIYHNAFTATAY